MSGLIPAFAGSYRPKPFDTRDRCGVGWLATLPGRDATNPESSISLRESASAAAIFLMGVVLAPVSITLLYRLPYRMPITVPFNLVTALAVGMFWRNWSRTLATGLVVGAVLHAVFLLYLFSTFYDID